MLDCQRKTAKIVCVCVSMFLKVTSIDFASSWVFFLGHLGGLGAVLEASWASWGRLDSVLGRLEALGNA